MRTLESALITHLQGKSPGNEVAAAGHLDTAFFFLKPWFLVIVRTEHANTLKRSAKFNLETRRRFGNNI